MVLFTLQMTAISGSEPLATQAVTGLEDHAARTPWDMSNFIIAKTQVITLEIACAKYVL